MSINVTDMSGSADEAAADRALPFQVEGLDVRGRVVTLGPALDAILSRHDFPDPVNRLVGEATVLAALLALGSVLTLVFIIAGAAGMMKFQYWRMMNET